MIPETHIRTLHTIITRLADADVVWALTGSMGLAVSGIPVEPHDIDIQTDEAGVYEFARLFADHMVQPPTFRETSHTQSYMARFVIDGVEVEVMGDMRHRAEDDSGWDDYPDLEKLRLFVQVGGMRAPVLPLEFEEEAYRRMGRLGKAALIGSYVRTC